MSEAGAGSWRSRTGTLGRIGSALVLLAAVAATVAFSGHILTAPLDRDEHMYIAAGKLWPAHRMYTDFPFLQTPYLPMVYSLVFASGVDHLLLAARFVTVAAMLTTVLVVGGLAYRLSREVVFAASAVLFLCASPAVQNGAGQAANYAAPMAASACALTFILWPGRNYSRACCAAHCSASRLV